MRHYSAEEWIDFVNRTTTPQQHSEMERHLDAGCVRCGKTESVFRRVRRAASDELHYQPSDGAVRVARAAFAPRRPSTARSAVQLLFDSLLQPALAGARALDSGPRHVLYEIGPYLIDLQLLPKTERGVLAVTGQLLNARPAETTLSGTSVVVSDCEGETVRVVTTQYGEFSAEVKDTGHVEVWVEELPSKKISISLRPPFSTGCREAHEDAVSDSRRRR